MDSYSVLLERIRVPQPSMQRFAVISIFEKLRSAPSNLGANSDSGRDAISQCLHSTSAAVVDQSVRELCRFVKEGHLEVPHGLLELQSALDGCDLRFVNVFVKGIGFLVRFVFQKNDTSWRLDSPETHPFVKVVSCRTEVYGELVQQVIWLIAQNKRTGLVEVCKFLRPFLNFLILRASSSASSFSFARILISSIASLSCSFPFETMPILKLMMECFKYFPRKNAEDMKNLIDVAEYLVDAFTVILRQSVETGSQATKDAQLCSVKLLETLLSFYTDFHNLSGGSELIFKLSKSVLLIQKELRLPYIPEELLSVKMSLFLILTRAEFEHEQLSVLKLAVILLKWKTEHEYISGEAASGASEEFLFLFPVISLLSSPSNSIKAAAAGFLSVLEDLLVHFSVASKKVPNISGEFPFISKPESIICRLLWDLLLQTNIKVMNSDRKPWMSQLREYSLWTVERKKSPLLPQSEGILSSEMPFLLGSINAVLVMHHSLGSSAVDSLAAIGFMDPRLGIPLLLAILFYNKVFCNNKSSSREILIKLLEVLPSLASHSVMIPLIVQTILPMLHKEAKPVLYATAIRFLCKTWEVTDRVFGNLQVLVHPKRFSEFMSERNICMSMAASVRDVCRKNPDRGVDLILSVSACIESQDPTIQALGFQSLSHLCEADVVDFYTAWDVIAKHVLDYTADPVLAHGICILLRWGAMDAEAYSESSKSVLQTLWQIGYRPPGFGPMWTKARVCAFESLTHYEVAHIQKSIPDFKKRNVDFLITEDNANVLKAMVEFEVKIITFEHINRRRLLKEKRTAGNKVEKLLDVFPQVIFHSGKENSYTRDFPGAALLLLSVTSKDVHNQRTPKELSNLHTAYENALVEVAESLQLSRNILVALLSLQSWKPFMQRWMKAVFVFVDGKLPSTALEKTSKIATDILKSMCRIAEESIPRCAENIALAIGAFCMVLPPSAHAITATASKFLLKWLFQYEHEYRQWSAAIALGLLSRCLHATDHKPKFQIIAGLLEVALSSKSTLVKGACGVGLGFTCEDLSGTVAAPDDSDLEGETDRVKEVNLLGKIVRTLSLIICQLIPSSSDSLQSLCEYFPLDTNDIDTYIDPDLSSSNHENQGEDLWGVAGLILGLGNSVSAIYRYGAHDAVLKIKSLFISWIPCVNADFQNPCGHRVEPEIPLSVGSCLALPIVAAFCQRVELIGESEVDHLVTGYKELICELLSLKKSGAFHQSLLMASCIGAGSLVSCILSEGVHPMKVEDVMSLLEMLRKCYTSPYPPIVHLGGMLGVVNALGASAGTLTLVYRQPSLRTVYGQKDSSYIREPILASPVCEPQSSSLVQEIFLVSQDSKDQQLQRYAAWALAFLRHHWWSKELQIAKHGSQSNQIDSGHVSQSFPEDSVVWKLCTWLMDLNSIGVGITAHVNTVATVLRCLSRAPRLPSLDWGVIIRRCMRFEDQVSGNLCPDPAVQRVTLREDCIQFSLAHANQINPLLLFLDELSDLSRFRTLELNLQLSLLRHLADLTKIFSVSRLEKLFDDMADYVRSPVSSYHTYNSNKKSLLRISFWKGLNQCLDEAFAESQEYVTNMEKCMEFLFASLPVLPFDATLRPEEANCIDEWSEGVTCLGKAPRQWLMNLLEVPEGGLVQRSHFTELVKRIQARAKLVMIGSIPLTELGKLKASILNTESDGIWDVLVEVAAALQYADGGIKRQWLIDVVEISCITKYPFTALQFLGLLSGSWCKYMPLLILDPMSVLSDLPVTLPSLLSDSHWNFVAESVVLNLWVLMERIYDWSTSLGSGSDGFGQQDIDEREDWKAVLLVRVMHHTCVSLLEYLPFEKQLKLANMMVPEYGSC
ncbi:protein RST1 isoform X3 [Telopea speciosissima]|uniref:protein RST1 isoform X3 n=1 Tax=Telopea speciosissima TaxID=54955 RepID=UPI001CC6DD89|nr:protein RST1 isoform X3 [Telopea speciosissima]